MSQQPTQMKAHNHLARKENEVTRIKTELFLSLRQFKVKAYQGKLKIKAQVGVCK